MAKQSFYSRVVILIVLDFTFSASLGSSEYYLVNGKQVKISSGITLAHPVFDKLERRWISSSYFDRGMHYENSQFEVVSFYRLLEEYGGVNKFDAIILNCFDDYQGLVSVNDIRRYDLQLAIKIKLSRESDRPDWLQPLLIVVPDGKHPPFLERFLTANISELKFVRLADYYSPLDREILPGSSAELGREIFKDNCLFCHSINGSGGNKGGSLLNKYKFQQGIEQRRFKDSFLSTHGQHNASKQNMKQFLADNDLEVLLIFLSEMNKG